MNFNRIKWWFLLLYSWDNSLHGPPSCHYGGTCVSYCPEWDSFSFYFYFFRDLSEQIKKVTKESHVRAENTELMLSFQRGQVTLPQYKVRKYAAQIFALNRALNLTKDPSFSPAAAPPVLPVWDLQSSGGRAEQELQPCWCGAHLLSIRTGQAGVHWERPGVFLRHQLERENSCSCRHQEILSQAQTGTFDMIKHKKTIQ